MYDILVRAGSLIGIIILGILLKKFSVFKQEDLHIFSRLMLNVTLTASIITSFAGREIDTSMLFMIPIGLLTGAFLIVFSILTQRRNGRDAQAFEILNLAGFNIGCMALPFARSFLGPVGVMAVCLFDTGNAVTCLGGGFSIAAMVKDKSRGFDLKFLAKKLGTSVPLVTYISMAVLCILHVRIPAPIISFTTTIGDANVFLAMFVVGIGFRLGGGSSIKKLLRIIGTRYVLAITAAALCWFLLPLSLECRQALVICLLAPVPASAVAYTAMLDGDYGLAGAINSTSITISFILLTLSLMVIL